MTSGHEKCLQESRGNIADFFEHVAPNTMANWSEIHDAPKALNVGFDWVQWIRSCKLHDV